MFIANVYGRLGKAPNRIETKTGKPMTAASMAVTLPCGSEAGTVWLNLVTFGKQAELLIKHGQGEMVSAIGRMQLNKWTDNKGTERENWQLVVETLTSSRTVRPGRQSDSPAGKLRGKEAPLQQPTSWTDRPTEQLRKNDNSVQQSDAEWEPFDDPIPFGDDQY